MFKSILPLLSYSSSIIFIPILSKTFKILERGIIYAHENNKTVSIQLKFYNILIKMASSHFFSPTSMKKLTNSNVELCI